MLTNIVTNVAGYAEFASLAAAAHNPLLYVDTLADGVPPIATARHAFLVQGAGRTGYGFARMAARAPGNEGAMVMVVPRDVVEWHRLATTNGNAQFLTPGVVFNPPREKKIHFLPPRDVVRKVRELEAMVTVNPDLEPALSWARQQLRDERTKRVTEYWLRATQVQAVTTRVRDMPVVVDNGFVHALHPQAKYVLLHPSKSIAAPRREGERPLFGQELLQALLTEGGRGDLTGWVVASGGYWVDSTVWQRDRLRVRFASTESEKAVHAAQHAIGGTAGSYDLVSISTEVGAAAVFGIQFGGWIKNFLANILGEKAARKAAVVGASSDRPDYFALQREYADLRQRLITEAQNLAGRALAQDGLEVPPAGFTFPDEVLEDIMACTTLNWPALVREASQLRLFTLGPRAHTGYLKNWEIESLQRGMENFVNTAPEGHFGTTNMTAGLVYGLALMLLNASLVPNVDSVFDRRKIVVPEGIRAMPYVAQRFGAAGLSDDFTNAIERFRPLYEG